MSARGILLETPGSWSEPMHWPLREGERKLLTVGSDADWSITGRSLLAVHATLYFDGESLRVAAAPGARLNGEPLGHEWSPLSLPAQLSLGDTNISLAPSERALGAQDACMQKTALINVPHLEDVQRAVRAEAREAPVPPHEAERVTPTGLFQSPFIDPDATQLALPTLGQPVQAPPLPTPTAAPANAPPSLARRSSARSQFARSFRAASWPKKLTLLLLPVVFGLLELKSARDRHAPPRALGAPRSSAARQATSSGALSVSAPARVTAPTPVPAASDGRSGGLTLQRRAVDAFATGNFQEAARLYQRLSEESPRDAAFTVAARLAKERASGANHD